ncbi:MAG: sigma-70 family RNA polymerase sigma factor [Cyanobacteria bacterium CRU_2_1]|nr:sigma-70 family RNA polymerase sigma factor [Cyanobacteria bacterium CRU_2_1]
MERTQSDDTFVRLNQHLDHLAQDAQQHSSGTLERQLALTKLIRLAQTSGKIYRPTNPGLSANLYDEICDEAIWETWLWVSKNIDRYDSTRGNVLTWINSTLYWRFKDRVSAWIQRQKTAPSIAETHYLEPFSSLDQTPSLSELVQRWFEDDPDAILCQDCIRGYPHVTFQAIALQRLAGKSWEEISTQFNGMKISTLSSFYQRCVENLAPQIRVCIQNYSYD